MTATKKPAAKKAQPEQPRMATISNEARDAMTTYLRSSCSIAEAARLSNLARRTVTWWRERGRIEAERIEQGLKPIVREAPYLTFWQDTENARLRRKVYALTVVQDLMGATQDANVRLKAAMFFLERGWPDEFGKRARDAEKEPRSDTETAAAADAMRRDALGMVDELEERRARKSG